MEVVANFKYLGRPLYQTYYDWLELPWNIKRERRVWGVLGGILIREGAYPKVAEIFYMVVIKEVLLFDSETWFLS